MIFSDDQQISKTNTKTVDGKKSFHNTESDAKILQSIYLFRLQGRHHQLLFK